MAINYIFPETNEPVQREPWRWIAVYADGSTLEQFAIEDGKAIFHRSGEIDVSRLVELQLLHDSHPAITVAVPADAKPVHLYRHKWVNELFTDPTSGELLNREWRTKIWVIGFKHNGTYCLVYVDEYGHTLVSNSYEMFVDKALPAHV